MNAKQPRNYLYPKRKFGKDERSFLPSWYEKWNWLHYDKVEDSVYCIICTNVYHHNMINKVKVENFFVKTGYSNWKNARSKDKGFHQHETSKCHQHAIQKLIEIPKSTKDVATPFKTNMIETQRENRASLLKIISCLCYLARKGLPFRGHGDEKDANFKQLIRFRAKDDPAFATWLKEKNLSYTSPEIQNEILKDMSLSILRDVVNCIKNSDFFSIMVDESSYISNPEQVVFCVHWVDEDLHSHEDFIGLCETEKTDATTMVNVIKDIFLRLVLDKTKLRGQCYDGCSTMMGKKKGVATLIKRDVQTLALSTILRIWHVGIG